MPEIQVKERESIDFAMRRFRRLCEKAGIISKVRLMGFHEKSSEKRKRKLDAARKRISIKNHSIRTFAIKFGNPLKKKETAKSNERE